MAFDCDKKIWILVKRYDLTDNGPHNETEVCVRILEGYGADEIRAVLMQTFGIDEERVVLKLKNSRGSLIPIGPNIAPNSKSVPYVLEVVRLYQNIKPKPRSIKISRYNETMRNKITAIIERIEHLEAAIPELSQMRNQKITVEMEELDNMLKHVQKTTTLVINFAQIQHYILTSSESEYFQECGPLYTSKECGPLCASTTEARQDLEFQVLLWVTISSMDLHVT
ncbi:hypothetical protein ScPMuIL_012053 [Solemya velum]